MRDVVIVSAARTALGSFNGSLSTVPAARLGAVALKGAVDRAGIDPETIDQILMGCVLPAGQGQAPGRQAAIYAGLPKSIPNTTVNKVCGSGLRTVTLGACEIMAGQADIVVAGGMENMSLAPYALAKARTGYRMGPGQIDDLMVKDGLWDPYQNKHMGMFAELCAAEHGIGRERQDDFAVMSYTRSLASIENGAFKDEIVPVEIPQRKGDPIVFDEDEEPKRFDEAKLRKLRPAFQPDGGTVTAGNASSINDGASALVLMSGDRARDLGIQPMARIVDFTNHANPPEWFTTAPAYAVEKLLEKTGKTQADVDVWEINEAFAVVALFTQDYIGYPDDKCNLHGGAVSLGHPIGCSGARILTTLLYAMQRHDGTIGVTSPCIGGGESVAVMVERV